MISHLFRCLVFFLLPGFFWIAAAEHVVRGRVVDADTGEPLAFVHLVIGDTRQGGLTDIDGFFRLRHDRPVEYLRLSYVGYLQKTYYPDNERDDHLITLHQQAIELQEVVVMPGENPAHRMIAHAIARRDQHNPDNLSSFSYKAYNKFIFTGELEDSASDPDTLAADTALQNISAFLEQRHFFLMETVTERKFRAPKRSNEHVLASRISGIQHPMFALLMSQMQSFSFYDDYIAILGERYLSPLAPGSLRRYMYQLEDTTYTGRDTVFVISYRPSRGRNFDGMKGVMYVNTRGWALQSVIAEPAQSTEEARIRIQQNYEYIDNRKWFPVQLNTDFELFAMPGMTIVGTGRTYLQDIRIDPTLGRRDFSAFHVEFSPETMVEDDEFWDAFRPDTLTIRERNTYHYLDSVADEHNLNRRIEWMETLFGGQLRMGPFDVDVNSLIGYNQHEGFRPGVAIRTNERVSRRFRLSGMAGYGFGDQTLKYGGGASVLLDRPSDLRIGYDYNYDTAERGGSEFLQRPGLLEIAQLRHFFLETMDLYETHQAWLQFRTFRNFLTLRPYISLEDVAFLDNYRYLPGQAGSTKDVQTRFVEAGFQLRLAYGERFLYSPQQIMILAGDHPVIRLNVARGLVGTLDGEHAYWRVEGRYQRNFRIRMLGRQQWTLQAGYFSGDAPWQKRFSAPASWRRFSVTTMNAFSTMRVDEFVSDRYLALFWYHHFENLLYRSENFNPKLVLLTNIGIGDLRDRENHLHAPWGTMEKGFFESGVALLGLIGSGFSSLGVEFAYRYGPYAFPEFKDNYTLRLSYGFMF